jgi:hypothetical protein
VRFGIGPEGRRLYDVHVTADERHASIARDRLVVGLMRGEPELGADLLFGAAALMMLSNTDSRGIFLTPGRRTDHFLFRGNCPRIHSRSNCQPPHPGDGS